MIKTQNFHIGHFLISRKGFLTFKQFWYKFRRMRTLWRDKQFVKWNITLEVIKGHIRSSSNLNSFFLRYLVSLDSISNNIPKIQFLNLDLIITLTYVLMDDFYSFFFFRKVNHMLDIWSCACQKHIIRQFVSSSICLSKGDFIIDKQIARHYV